MTLGTIMGQLLFRIDDVFTIKGRGVVVVDDVVEWPADLRLRVGDPIEVVRADGSRLRTVVRGVEWMHVTGPARWPVGVLLGPEVERADVAAGDEVRWVGPAGGSNQRCARKSASAAGQARIEAPWPPS